MGDHEHIFWGLDAVGIALALGMASLIMAMGCGFLASRLERRVKRLEDGLRKPNGSEIIQNR